MARASVWLTAVFLAAGSMAPIGGAAAADAVKWRHGVLEAKSDAGIIFMGAKGGFTQKQGVDVEIMQMRDDPISLKALLSGEVETIEGSPGSTLIAGSRGADIKILGCYWPVLQHGVFVQENINSVADLKGKTIAIAGPSGVPDLVIRAMLQKFNVPVSDVSLANLGSDLDRYKALVAGVAAATVVSLENVPIAAKSHLKVLLAAKDVMPDYVRICIMTTGKVLSERRADAVKFIAGEMQGLSFALSHRDETLKLTRDIAHTAEDDPRAPYLFDEVVKDRLVDPDMSIPLAKLDWLQKQLVSMGNITAPYDLSRIVDQDVRKEALKSAGR